MHSKREGPKIVSESWFSHSFCGLRDLRAMPFFILKVDTWKGASFLVFKKLASSYPRP
jgi:hypothetical protein